MLGQPTGLTKDVECVCGKVTSQYHVRAGGQTFWVTKEHKAPCGRPCSLSPGSTGGDCHMPGKCELCPTPSGSRRGPRARVKSETNASPILGPLTVNEVRIMHYLMDQVVISDIRWVTNQRIGNALGIPDTTVRGTFRRLAVRGLVFQHKNKAWHINLSIAVKASELSR